MRETNQPSKLSVKIFKLGLFSRMNDSFHFTNTKYTPQHCFQFTYKSDAWRLLNELNFTRLRLLFVYFKEFRVTVSVVT